MTDLKQEAVELLNKIPENKLVYLVELMRDISYLNDSKADDRVEISN